MGLIDNINTARWYLGEQGKTCEVLKWESQVFKPKQLVLYVPGLPGETISGFDSFASEWIGKNTGRGVWGILHSGINTPNGTINQKEGVTSDDWVDDVKVAVLKASRHNYPLTIIAHSFGGLFAFHALAELVKEGSLDPIKSTGSKPIRFITVSTPFYDLSSLPDRRPLLGTDSELPFTFYRDTGSEEKISENDNRIPMASKYAFERIGKYLNESGLINISKDESLFNFKLLNLLNLKESAEIVGKTDITIVNLFLRQDRWVDKKSGENLQNLIQRPILNELCDIPDARYKSMVGINAHDLVDQWAPIATKYI